MAQLYRAALLMSQDDLQSALNEQTDPKHQKPKPVHSDHDVQTAPDSLPVEEFSLMPYETAEIQESTQSFEQAVDDGEQDSDAATRLWDEPTKPADS
jgi:hypothetical protein